MGKLYMQMKRLQTKINLVAPRAKNIVSANELAEFKVKMGDFKQLAL